MVRVSTDLNESGRLFHACIVDGRKESAYVRCQLYIILATESQNLGR